MRPNDQARWKCEALEVVFAALASSRDVSRMLVFKGARVLNLLLQAHQRQSLDIDSNIIAGSLHEETREEQARLLAVTIESALNRYFEQSSPQRYSLKRVSVVQRPRKRSHPMGWNAFDVTIGLIDLMRDEQRGLPSLTMDIAAPEELLPDSCTPLSLDGQSILVYTLERIAGEKLRAFLTSLPSYARKLDATARVVRAKDLYDVARIEEARPVARQDFWRRVGQEFRMACKSRFVTGTAA